ncbi:hypothetical protein BJV74DRAFT_793199 [Russula compacta]|nr:hypothetical protein BJV74DRAFT_793199 [Russula compacta]
MASISANLFRSGSSSSLGSSSDERLSTTPNPTVAKRTRKRFTGSQLAMLEHLYHRTSHPSREERETLARELNLEPKVVTIWFQNRRQTERKATLTSTTAAASQPTSLSSPAVRPTPRRCRASVTHSLSSPYAHHPPPPPPPPSLPPTPLARRPTLEAMARRSELRTAPPRTPSKRPDPNKSPWDNMPSSPLVPPSPPEREFVQFGMGRRSHKRSLEWACAAARLGKHAARRQDEAGDDDEDETDEEEPHEAITPMGSLIGDTSGDVFWGARSITGRTATNRKPKDPENELMDAALLLCGLGQKLA